ncbi:hydrogenase maturation protease [bacterium]|nr:hydrogenase maturation protease [bacterium]
MKRLLIGYGNELRGDDGAAWELARRAALVGWKTLCVVQLTPELAETVSQFDQVVFVDATHEPGPLGWQLIKPKAGQEWPIHSGEPGRLLGLCQSLYGKSPKGWIMTLPGEDFGYRLGLSEFSQASVVEGLERLRKVRLR